MKNVIYLKKIVYILFIGLIVYFQPIILINYQASSNFNFFIYNTIMFLLNGSIGLILGLDKLFSESVKEGSWKVNLPHFLIMGIPSIYFSFGIIISTLIRNFISYPINIFFNNGPLFMYIFQVVFAYILITSFYKENI